MGATILWIDAVQTYFSLDEWGCQDKTIEKGALRLPWNLKPSTNKHKRPFKLGFILLICSKLAFQFLDLLF